jgi:hypothetical protein
VTGKLTPDIPLQIVKVGPSYAIIPHGLCDAILQFEASVARRRLAFAINGFGD